MTTRAHPFGKYHLLERVNVGGMAEVYRAKMVGVEGFEKPLAIKRILPAIAADRDFIRMFIDEAKITVQLAHANIAQTFELGRINDTYYMAMEFVSGRDLRAAFERLRRRGDVVPQELACYVLGKVAEGLDYAHRKCDPSGRGLGIVHRDVSPQNVLISYEGEVKLIDFGIAKATNKMMKTQAGILKGKFGYMSPEQVMGEPLDRRSDIFAIGIVLYELLAGERLFVGESDYAVLEKVRNATVPRILSRRRSVPEPLERIALKALAQRREDRYQYAGELAADLQRYLLSRDRLFTREDLAAFMKSTFAAEFEAETQSQLSAQAAEEWAPIEGLASRAPRTASRMARPVDLSVSAPRPYEEDMLGGDEVTPTDDDPTSSAVTIGRLLRPVAEDESFDVEPSRPGFRAQASAMLSTLTSPEWSVRHAPLAWMAAGALAVVSALGLSRLGRWDRGDAVVPSAPVAVVSDVKPEARPVVEAPRPPVDVAAAPATDELFSAPAEPSSDVTPSSQTVSTPPSAQEPSPAATEKRDEAPQLPHSLRELPAPKAAAPAAPGAGTLRLVAKPARVYVDGRDTGLSTPLNPGLALAAGRHRVRLETGEVVREFDVELAADEVMTRIERLP